MRREKEKNILFNGIYCFKFRNDFSRRSFGEFGNDEDDCGSKKECRKKFINGEPADTKVFAHGGEYIFPDENHCTAGKHTCNCCGMGNLFPEKADEHKRAEGCAKACPGEGNNVEDNAVFIKSNDDTEKCNKNKDDFGTAHDLFVGCSSVENLLIKVFGKSGSGNKKIGVGRTDCCGKNTGHDYTGNDRGKKLSANDDENVFSTGRGKKNFFGGK